MFSIEYLILQEEMSRISKIWNASEFDILEGQLCLTFNTNSIGFIEKEVEIGNELLFFWFQQLNEVLIYLQSYKTVYFYIPDRHDEWLVFEKKEDILTVENIESKPLACIPELVSVTPIEKKTILWREIIETDEFYNKIYDKTHELLTIIKQCNHILINSEDYRDLQKLFEKISI